MPVPFSQTCGSCGSKLSIKKAELIGKRIRCPKCQKPILVEEPADEPIEEVDFWDEESPDDFSDDDWGGDFDDDLVEEVEDDFDDEFGGDFDDDFDEEPRAPRKRRGPKKSASKAGRKPAGKSPKKRKKSSKRKDGKKPPAQPAWLKPAIFGGGGLVVVVLIVALIFAGGGDEPDDPQANSDDLAANDQHGDPAADGKHDDPGALANGGGNAPAFDPTEVTKPVREVFAPERKPVAKPNPNTRPDVVKQEPATAKEIGDDLPPYAANLVLVYRNHEPAGVLGGVCLEQSKDRRLIWIPVNINLFTPTEAQNFEVEFHPGKPERQRFRARALTPKRFKGQFLEVVGKDLPKLPEIPWEPEPIKRTTGLAIRIVGLRKTDDQTFEWVDQESTWGTYDKPKDPPPGLQAGALISRIDGGAVGLFNGQERSPLVEYSTSMRTWLFPRAHYSLKNRLKFGYAFDYKSKQEQFGNAVMEIASESVIDQVWIGNAFDLDPKEDRGSLIFDEPIMEKMAAVPLQIIRTYRDHLNRNVYAYQAIIPFQPEFDFSETPIIVQCRVIKDDGTYGWTQPNLMATSNHAFGAIVDSSLNNEKNRYEREKGGPPSPIEIQTTTREPFDNESAGPWKVSPGNDPGLLNEFAWSKDGESFLAASQYGKVQLVRAEGRKERKRLNLFVYANDIDVSEAGWLVLGEQTLFVLESQSLKVVKEIPVRGAFLLASTWDSSIAVAASQDRFWRVDLKAGKVEPIFVEGQEEFAVPSGDIVGMEMLPDGDILVADQARVHRLKLELDSARRVESSPYLGGIKEFVAESNGLVAVTLARPLTLPTLPRGNSLIFTANQLNRPIFGVDAFRGFDAFTGGIFYQMRGLVCADGRGRAAGRADALMVLTRHAASPNGKYLLVQTNNNKDAGDRREEFAFEKDALLGGTLDFQPEHIGKSAIAQTQQIAGWQIDELNLTSQQPPQRLGQTNGPLSILQGWTWSADGEHVYLLTTDEFLYKLRVADRVLESKIDIPLATQVAMTSEGLVVGRDRQNQLLLFDPSTLALKQTFAMFAAGEMIGNPNSPRIWLFRDRYARQVLDPNTLVSFDVKTGKPGRGYVIPDFQAMTKEVVAGLNTAYRMQIERPIEMQITSENRYLFLNDGKYAAKFGIHNDELAFHEITPQFGSGSNAPLVLSPDSHLISLGLGRIDEKVTGLRIRSAHDFSKVLYDLPEAGRTLEYAIAGPKYRLYASAKDNPLMELDENKTWQKISFPSKNEQSRIEAHPTKDALLLHGAHLYWAEKTE